jgi:hypothetical protein
MGPINCHVGHVDSVVEVSVVLVYALREHSRHTTKQAVAEYGIGGQQMPVGECVT